MNSDLLNYVKLFADHAVRDNYARKTNGYARVQGKVTNLLLERHLTGEPIGLYTVFGDKVRLSTFDIDDHDGSTGWSAVADAARQIMAAASKLGLFAHPWRSGGGAGIHLHFFFLSDQPAADVRYAMRSLLAEIGITDGAGGIAAKEVEVFPKQDRVAPGGVGNLIAVPAARESLPLRIDTLEPYPLADFDWLELANRYSNSVPRAPEEAVKRKRLEPLGNEADECRAALRNAPSDEHGSWIRIGLALKYVLGDAGFEVWNEWSARSAKYPGEARLTELWDGFKPNGDVGLGTIFHFGQQNGWNGPTDAFVREMNARFGILTFGNTTLIIPKNGDRHPDDDFMGLSKRTFLDRLAPETIVVDAGADGGTKRIKKAPAWLSHEKACHYHRLDFDPSKPPGGNGRTWNLWTGFGVEPRPGDWSLLQEHICGNISRGDSAKADWLFNWMAFGVQHPATPIGTAVVMIGFPGTGKGVLAHAYGKLWGNHYISLTHAEHVSGRFTGHFAGRRLVFVDEGTFGGNRAIAGNLKTRVTEPWLVLERKGVDAVRMRNRMIFMIASNEASVVPADKADRRWMVYDVGDYHREDHAYFGAIQAQLDDGGYEAMLYDLLHRDLKQGADPRRIIRTEALFEQVLLAGGPELRYVHHLLDAGRLPQNIVAGAASTTIKALVMDMRSQHFDAGYINDVRLGKLLHEMVPGVRTAISGTYLATDKSGETFKERSTRYTFPALSQARREFEKYVRTPVSWSEVAEWQNDPDDTEDDDRGYPGDITF